MNMKQFRYVQVLASAGSFSKASELLDIKQPSLSQCIKKIEQDLGIELFDRTGGNIRLTDAGRTYIQIGMQILGLECQLDSRLKDIAEYKTGTISVGISAHRSVALMPSVVKKFREAYPGIILHIEERKRYEILDATRREEFDLCLTTLPVDCSTVSYETAFVEENVLAVPADRELDAVTVPGRAFPAVSVSALNHAKFAMLNDEHPMQHELKQLCEDHCLVLTPTVICSGLNALLEMVRVGMGFAFVPLCMATRTEGVRFYSIAEETHRREIVVMYRKGQHLSEPVLYLKELLKQR